MLADGDGDARHAVVLDVLGDLGQQRRRPLKVGFHGGRGEHLVLGAVVPERVRELAADKEADIARLGGAVRLHKARHDELHLVRRAREAAHELRQALEAAAVAEDARGHGSEVAANARLVLLLAAAQVAVPATEAEVARLGLHGRVEARLCRGRGAVLGGHGQGTRHSRHVRRAERIASVWVHADPRHQPRVARLGLVGGIAGDREGLAELGGCGVHAAKGLAEDVGGDVLALGEEVLAHAQGHVRRGLLVTLREEARLSRRLVALEVHKVALARGA
mmetsp:Transcript_15765/g.42355  ORF Transcript_15765/g.42355 Transcript_15765/m.42355 type:complete len:277 (+) Transcript_15765:3309-4139(+)